MGAMGGLHTPLLSNDALQELRAGESIRPSPTLELAIPVASFGAVKLSVGGADISGLV